MNLIIAALAGAGIGFAFFGGLWVSIRCTVRRPRRRGMIAVCGALRWVLAVLAFFIVSRAGGASVVAAFGGFWLTRSIMILGLSEVLHAE
jgi:hypothetical protein